MCNKKTFFLIIISSFSCIFSQNMQRLFTLSEQEKAYAEICISCIACGITIAGLASQQPCIITSICSTAFPCASYCCFSAARRMCCPERCRYCDIFQLNSINFIPEQEYLLRDQPIVYFGPPFQNINNEIISISFPSQQKQKIKLGVIDLEHHPKTSSHQVIQELQMNYSQN